MFRDNIKQKLLGTKGNFSQFVHKKIHQFSVYQKQYQQLYNRKLQSADLKHGAEVIITEKDT